MSEEFWLGPLSRRFPIKRSTSTAQDVRHGIKNARSKYGHGSYDTSNNLRR